ncbi:D-beta-D-heptose 7-phosphate kinase/D-beta-D-heptose 1-phosphate adenosyltransferase [Lacibacter cauensis]|uniref:D-glycero-beta-D-manno-heptose 1-phosphate adenylyltransferase n=1 Tax=Lacibacter cauensis TaxID=510947 RepID=A0A562SVN9_9BACT|nr:D-glycero-beta-D-manno-heptose 1-phosphate adenylyltransferase [Lacibacter cauensis]TWI85357.1 D-beta-D-heptose 7-phosphate kinase/D-beta-D-heptose 1-phosphate adenosyltransferase [Lacibacter cauensis]
MKSVKHIQQKIHNQYQLQQELMRWRKFGKTVAFTNGCFDILHAGHIHSLMQAASFADVLVVGLNSDASTKRLKGENRPVNNEQNRALVLASLVMVDAVVLFDEDTPFNLITTVMPDVLVKGGDYTVDTIVGAKEVMANGGKIEIIPLVEGLSTTSLLHKIEAL